MLLEDAKLDCEYHPQLHRAPYIPPSFPPSPAHFFRSCVYSSSAVSFFIFHNFIYFLWAKAVASLRRASFVSQPFQKVSIWLHRHHKSVCYFQPSSSRVACRICRLFCWTRKKGVDRLYQEDAEKLGRCSLTRPKLSTQFPYYSFNCQHLFSTYRLRLACL